MGKRSTSRRLAMQALYQAEISGCDIETALNNITEAESFIPQTLEFSATLAKSAWAARAELDQTISNLAIGWSLDRIGKVDRAILRLAVQEINDGATPQSVVINEAVEMAKKYSNAEAARFINGILGALVRRDKQ